MFYGVSNVFLKMCLEKLYILIEMIVIFINGYIKIVINNKINNSCKGNYLIVNRIYGWVDIMDYYILRERIKL